MYSVGNIKTINYQTHSVPKLATIYNPQNLEYNRSYQYSQRSSIYRCLLRGFPSRPISPGCYLLASSQKKGYLRDRDPADEKGQRKTEYSNNPVRSIIVCTIVSENDIEDDSAKVARGPGQSRYDTVVCRMDVRDNSKVRTISCFREEGSSRNCSDESVDIDTWNCSDADQDDTLNCRT
jgi:hypothetical protein